MAKLLTTSPLPHQYWRFVIYSHQPVPETQNFKMLVLARKQSLKKEFLAQCILHHPKYVHAGQN
jgi:hypothetical protein